MRIAVAGAGDFVGARLIESFHLGAGPSVVAVAPHAAGLTAAARFALELRVADFNDIDSLARGFSGCSAVVHVQRAAPEEMKRGVHTLCRAAARAGVRRLVYLSSAEIHGVCPPAGTSERTPLNTHHAGERINALVVAERHFFTECRQLDLAGYALRAGYVFGPRSPAFAGLALALQEERAWLYQRGEGICNTLYLDNLVAAIRLALKARTGAGSPFLLGDAETITWRDFYHSVARELHLSPAGIRNIDEVAPAISEETVAPESTGKRRRGASPSAPPVSPRAESLPPEELQRQQCGWKLSHARAAAELGYEPAVSFAEGVRRSVAWWRFAQGELFAA